MTGEIKTAYTSIQTPAALLLAVLAERLKSIEFIFEVGTHRVEIIIFVYATG